MPSAAMLRQLRDLQAPPREQEADKGGFVLVPPILPHDQWEALAAVSQDDLAAATMEGVDRPRGQDNEQHSGNRV
jgi:hypothetical protein